MVTLPSEGSGFRRGSIKLIHQNIRGLFNKLNETEIFLEHESPDFVCLTEHNLKDMQLQSLVLKNYGCRSAFCRSSMRGGGVGIWSRPNISCTALDCQQIEGVCEIVSISVKTINKGNMLLVAVYRPPNSNHEMFFNNINECLNRYVHDHVTTVVMGDFNIDLSVDTFTGQKLISLMISYDLHNIIKSYTREAQGAQSMIDHIFTNDPKAKSSVLVSTLSDHYAQAVHVDLTPLHNIKEPKYKYARSFNNPNLKDFIQYLSHENWFDMFNSVDINTKYKIFSGTLAYYFDLAFPKVLKKTRVKKINKARLSTNTLRLKNELLELYMKTKHLESTHFMREYYKRLKYQYRAKVREEKSNEILDKIQSSENKSKTIWKIINDRRPMTNRERPENCLIDNKGELTYDPLHIARTFNEYFIKISSDSCLRGIGSPVSKEGEFIRTPQSFFLYPTSTKEIINIIASLKNKNSAGGDEISTRMLKLISEVIASPLSHLINYSFTTGVFPEALKLAIVKPILKKGNGKCCENYRPISVLPSMSKVFEKAVLNRLWTFLDKYNIIFKNQHGFVKNRSTTSAMFALIDDIVANLDEGMVSAGVFFDLSRAFDTISHELLLGKIDALGVRGLALDWFDSYLRGRKQCVGVSSVDESGYLRHYISPELSTLGGVPQGSILGPTLFLLYINNLSQSVGSARTFLYADDASLSLSRPTVESLEQTTFVEANCLYQWFDNNLLSLNKHKTQLINFHISDRLSPAFSFLLNDILIHPTQCTKFLGLILDDKLKFHLHIEHVINRVSSGIFAIRTLSKSSNSIDLLLSAYYGLIFPHLVYALPLWGCETQRTIYLFRLQKRAIRTIFSLDRLETCKHIFKSSKILTFPSLYIFETLSFFKQNVNKFKTEQQQYHNLRLSNNVHLPVHHTAFFEKHLRYNAIALFNKLPNHMKAESSRLVFRRKLKALLINKCYYSVRDFMADRFENN